jgi:outer membrane protein
MKRKSVITLVSLACCLYGSAQEWSYYDCVEWAKEHNISLQQSRINETIAGYDLESAQAQWQPTLDFATTHGYTNTPFGKGNKNSYNSSYGLNAGWTVWNGGIRENNIKRSKISTEIDRLNTEEILRGIETDLLSVYINILYARESISIYEEAVELSKAQADRARQLMEAGRLSKVDYAQLESQYEQDRYNLVNAKGTYDNRRMELKTLLQLGINDNITLQDVTWTREQVMAELPDIDDSYKLAIQTDKKIQALKLSDEQADLDIAIAKGGRMPNISLSAGVGTGYYAPGGAFGTQMKQSINESVGLTFSVPILDNKKNKTAIAKAKAQQLNAQLDIDSRYNDIARNVETWYIDLRAAQSRYAAGEEQVKSTTLSNDLVNEQFKLGLVNTVELMTAHNNLLEARHSLLQAKYMAMLGHKMIEFYRTATITMP